MIGVSSSKQYWKLTYLSILDGQRHTYMNIAFESPERAQREQDALELEYQKRWSKWTDDEIRQMYINGTQMYVSIIGRDYEVEPIKLRAL